MLTIPKKDRIDYATDLIGDYLYDLRRNQEFSRSAKTRLICELIKKLPREITCNNAHRISITIMNPSSYAFSDDHKIFKVLCISESPLLERITSLMVERGITVPYHVTTNALMKAIVQKKYTLFQRILRLRTSVDPRSAEECIDRMMRLVRYVINNHPECAWDALDKRIDFKDVNSFLSISAIFLEYEYTRISNEDFIAGRVSPTLVQVQHKPFNEFNSPNKTSNIPLQLGDREFAKMFTVFQDTATLKKYVMLHMNIYWSDKTNDEICADLRTIFQRPPIYLHILLWYICYINSRNIDITRIIPNTAITSIISTEVSIGEYEVVESMLWHLPSSRNFRDKEERTRIITDHLISNMIGKYQSGVITQYLESGVSPDSIPMDTFEHFTINLIKRTAKYSAQQDPVRHDHYEQRKYDQRNYEKGKYDQRNYEKGKYEQRKDAISTDVEPIDIHYRRDALFYASLHNVNIPILTQFLLLYDRHFIEIDEEYVFTRVFPRLPKSHVDILTHLIRTVG
jgi:hypothetical protein